ncbi:PREDICTED: C-type lectin domain family 2 member L-like isoform X1 [Haliaeetus leucocephalus]|uniref:C-type lectin domain family 2 member L-like isoform X1 n=1 Tax=Haliaeetus leucocephalus TaxID=52644 RepID=UPI00053CB505|nr:PREDICTED: C-type lectin domain family 2 member L-like isoform X1 [Haliaeetus leucocephalus]
MGGRGLGGSGGSPERGSGAHKGLFSNIWLWRGVAGVLTAAVILILCIQFVNRSSAKDFPVCPSLELCPSGWLYFQRKCYYLSESEANWNSSQSLCSLYNASLLVIENDQELSFMVKITKQDPWIGLYKRNEEFFWVNGKALDNKLICLQKRLLEGKVKLQIYVARAVLCSWPCVLSHRCQVWDSLFLPPTAVPSSQRLLLLVLGQLPAGTGRITSDNNKH